jgi:cysteine desulfurase
MAGTGIYLDYAATTPLRAEVLEAMLPYFCQHYGNPSSIHAWGHQAHAAIEQARQSVAAILECEAEEVIFTSGGTEGDNLALKGIAWAQRFRGRHIITSQIEHHAVLHTCQALEQQGFEVTYLPVDSEGLVSPEALEQAIRNDTILISIMYANNEIGTIEPLSQISQLAHARAIPFHTDAVQAGGLLDLRVDVLGVDALTLSAHKFYGPKGMGVLYLRRSTPFQTQQHGGGQEDDRRSGTHNVPGIVGLAAALELAYRKAPTECARLTNLRDTFIEGILTRIPQARLNGARTRRLPNNVHVAFAGLTSVGLVEMLDTYGIGASAGSACSAGSTQPSHVLQALNLPAAYLHGALRLTLGAETTSADIETTLEVLPECVSYLRQLAPQPD